MREITGLDVCHVLVCHWRSSQALKSTAPLVNRCSRQTQRENAFLRPGVRSMNNRRVAECCFCGRVHSQHWVESEGECIQSRCHEVSLFVIGLVFLFRCAFLYAFGQLMKWLVLATTARGFYMQHSRTIDLVLIQGVLRY